MIAKNISNLDLSMYELVIFDWDGTLLDSASSFDRWDQLYLKEFYGVELPLELLTELASRLKNIQSDHTKDSQYFRYLDVKYGDGKTPINKIWQNIYQLSSRIQNTIDYKGGSVELLKILRNNVGLKIALATNAEYKDLQFYASEGSITAAQINPLNFFDKVVTIDDVSHPKPHPETFQKVIEYFCISPDKVLIFEDSLAGVQAAKQTGAHVVSVYDKMADSHRDAIDRLSDYSIKEWSELLVTTKEGK